MFFVGYQSIGQTLSTVPPAPENINVFSEDFQQNTSGDSYTVGNNVPIGNSTKWKLTRSGEDFGAKIYSGGLDITNYARQGSKTNGWGLGSVRSSFYSAPYSDKLKDNPGPVTWIFSIKQGDTNPSGFENGNVGIAFILAGSVGTSSQVGTGYAVTLGNTGSPDPIRLVHYNSGIRNSSTLITSNTAGLTNFSNSYISVKVVYDPATDIWQLYLRNDGSGYVNSKTGTLVSQGESIANSTYTTTPLPIMGGLYNAGTANRYSFFEQVDVYVGVPYINSINPATAFVDSPGFTMTVNGKNFNANSKVYLNNIAVTTTYVSPTELTANILPSNIATVGTYPVKVINGTTSSNNINFTVKASITPTVTAAVESLNFPHSVFNTPSAVLNYQVNAVNLTSDVVVNAPTNFEISLSNNSGFSSSLTLARNISTKTLATQPSTIYVRKKQDAPIGIYNVNISHTTGGTSIVEQVSLNAVVIAVEPTTQSTWLNFTEVTSNSFKIDFTSGGGTRRMIVLRAAAAVTSLPVDGFTYPSNAVFGGGAEIGTGNFVVYADTGNSVTVTGLEPETRYYISVVEYNGVISGTENYLTTGTLLTGNQLTRKPALGWQIYAANTVNKIDFDSTVDGVNRGSFQGAGISPTDDAGDLNSNSWAITGFSTPDIGFGGTSTQNSAYDRGVSTGGVPEGGVYAFETSPNNFSLGVHTTDADFSPGTITLRVQNQTNVTVNSLNVGYKVFIRNDQSSSSSFNFSHSSNATTGYVAVSAIDVNSPIAPDEIPQWKGNYRATTISGLDIAPGEYYYLRWSGSDAGNVTYDEFALDDIVLVVNPSTTFVPFSNTAETFVLNGNAQLSGNLQVNKNLTFNGGKVSIGNNTLSIGATITNSTSGGLVGSTSSNVIINGTSSNSLDFDLTTPGITNVLNNITIASTGTNTTTLINPLVLNGKLVVDEKQKLDLGIHPLAGTLTNNATINGVLFTQNTSLTPLPENKTWAGTGIVIYNGSGASQTVVYGTYPSLTIDNTQGAVTGGLVTVNGELNLPKANPNPTTGSLSTGTNELFMGPNAKNIGIGDVTGIVKRTSFLHNVVYTLGHPNTSINFNFVQGEPLPTSISLKTQIGVAPSWQSGAVQRIYDLIYTGTGNTKAILKGHYLESELNENDDESRLVNFAHVFAGPATLDFGRSYYDPAANWIELYGVNLSNLFKDTFGEVELAFDYTSVADTYTWTGAANTTSWITAANWSPVGPPTTTSTAIIPNVTGLKVPKIDSDDLKEITNLIIKTGGKLDLGDNSKLIINGGAGAWINNGTFNPGTGTSEVKFTNADATIGGDTTFNNLTIPENAGLTPLTGNVMHIAGVFDKTGYLNAGAVENTLDFTGTNQVIPELLLGILGYSNIIINGTGAVFPTSDLSIVGNLTFNKPVDFTGKKIKLIGSRTQVVGGSSPPIFNNLEINNTSGGVILESDMSVTGLLTLNNGHLTLNGNNLTLGNSAIAGTYQNNTFSSANMIVTNGEKLVDGVYVKTQGMVKKPFASTGSYLFPVGDNAGIAAYSPITVTLTEASSFNNGLIGVSVGGEKHPNNYSMENYLNRYWNVTQTGIDGAVVTINGTYTPEDLSADVNTIAAAQLDGNFNQSINPWIVKTPLGINSLNVIGTTLTSGITSAFTGIKGGALSVEIYGFGSFCINSYAELNATIIGGDAPYIYEWSGSLGSDEIAEPATDVIGSATYGLTIRDANGLTEIATAVQVEVLDIPLGGAITSETSAQSICKGSLINNIELTGNTAEILYWEKSTDPLFPRETTSSISNFTNILLGINAGKVFETTYFRAVVNNGSCADVYSEYATVTIESTTYQAGGWSNGEPDGTSNVIIKSDYSPTDLVACSVTIVDGATLTIPSEKTLTINGTLFITDGSVIIEDTASLLQTDDTAKNEGSDFTARRNTQPMIRYDFTYWSSPVLGQTLKLLSPTTLFDKYFGWNVDEQSWITYKYGTEVMQSGLGYSVRAPQNTSTTVPVAYPGSFKGVPNNGVFTLPVLGPINGSDRFNLLGNPYPSALDAEKFINQNLSKLEGTLYFWTHNTAPSSSNGYYYTYSAADYASYNYTGGTSTATGTAAVGNNSSTPNGKIASGQGFFAKGKADGFAEFNNSMRIAGNNNQFFKSAASEIEKHRVWLNISNTNGSFRQMLVGYTSNATTGYDNGWDGELMSNSLLTVYGFAEDKKLTIQALPVPFNSNSIVPIGYNTNFAGSHRITLDQFDGLFENQNVYIHDKSLEIIHDLKTAPYDFTTAVGTFDERFEIVYVNSTLGDPDFDFQKQIYVYKENENIVVKSPLMEMKAIKVIDLQGRVIQTFSDVNALEAFIALNVSKQVLLISVITNENMVITKKLLY